LPAESPLSTFAFPKTGSKVILNIKTNKSVEISRGPRALVWGRTLLPDAFDLDLDFAEDDQDVCSNVEERRFSAAMIA